MRAFVWILMCVISLSGADRIYNEGKKLYFAKGCNGCHGVDAKGLAQYPGLAYRPKAFLTYKLQRYRKKIADTQQAQLMIPFAMALTDSQIDALTTFLSDYHENIKQKYIPDDSMTGGGSS